MEEQAQNPDEYKYYTDVYYDGTNKTYRLWRKQTERWVEKNKFTWILEGDPRPKGEIDRSYLLREQMKISMTERFQKKYRHQLKPFVVWCRLGQKHGEHVCPLETRFKLFANLLSLRLNDCDGIADYNLRFYELYDSYNVSVRPFRKIGVTDPDIADSSGVSDVDEERKEVKEGPEPDGWERWAPFAPWHNLGRDISQGTAILIYLLGLDTDDGREFLEKWKTHNAKKMQSGENYERSGMTLMTVSDHARKELSKEKTLSKTKARDELRSSRT